MPSSIVGATGSSRCPNRSGGFPGTAIQAITGLRLADLDMLLPRDGDGEEPVIHKASSESMISMHRVPWSDSPPAASREVRVAVPGGVANATGARVVLGLRRTVASTQHPVAEEWTLPWT